MQRTLRGRKTCHATYLHHIYCPTGTSSIQTCPGCRLLGIVILLSAFIKHKTFLDVIRPVLHSPFFSSGSCPLPCLSWTAYCTNTMTILTCSLLHFRRNAHYSRTRNCLRLLTVLLCRRFFLSVLNNSVDRHLQSVFLF